MAGKTNKTDQVREWFRNMETGSSAECAAALGMKNANVYRRIQELLKRGWLVQQSYGVFRYQEIPEHLHGKTAELQTKMWRAIRIARTVTTWDVAQFSGATYEYAQMYIRHLLAEKLIEKTGSKQGQRPVYRCRAEIRHETPIMRANRKGTAEESRRLELMETGWELMRSLRIGDLAAAGKALRTLREKI